MSLVTDDVLHDFLEEAGDMLDDVDTSLLDLEKRPDDVEILNSVFRGFHTIKGGAGFLEAHALVDLCHKGESLLDALRQHKLSLSTSMMDVILAATAAVRDMFTVLANGAMPEPADPELLESLERALHADRGETPVEASLKAGSPAVVAVEVPQSGPDWPTLFAAVSGIWPDHDGAPVKVRAPASGVDESIQVPTDHVASTFAPAPSIANAARSAPPAPPQESLRVDISRFDQILNLAGEIGLAKNRLMALNREFLQGQSTDKTLKSVDRTIKQLNMLVSELQNAVMKARMQQVGRVMQKYTRLARDLSRQLGKNIELVLEGSETELDKTLLDELNDPLVHLIRNAIDHGIEMPDERIAAGKPAQAIVRLSARQAGDTIVISIVDDGRGMNPDTLRRKAVEKGLIGDAEARLLSDAQALELIFLPGFSTKSEISSVSGRGVGMDVVRTNVQRLSGRITIDSEIGHGSHISLVLPLTLAILPVLTVRMGGQLFALPLTAVQHVIDLSDDIVKLVSGQRSVVVRDDVLPVIELAELLDWECQKPARVGVVLDMAGTALILAVDSFVGRDDVVIKPLEAFRPRGVAGATQAPDGSLVLILDLHELLADLIKPRAPIALAA